VYVEKPCSHNLREGGLMVEAARRNNCVVQHGTPDILTCPQRLLSDSLPDRQRCAAF
jgi:predicted dehydrogenase